MNIYIRPRVIKISVQTRVDFIWLSLIFQMSNIFIDVREPIIKRFEFLESNFFMIQLFTQILQMKK